MSNFDNFILSQEFNLNYVSKDNITDSDEEVFKLDSNFDQFIIKFSNTLSKMIVYEEEDDIEIEVYI